MKEMFLKKMTENPIIVAVKDINNMRDAVKSDCKVIFLLCGNIFNLKENVKLAKENGKIVFLHIDLIDGFSHDSVALRYINEEIKPDGIISTKNSQLKVAKELGLLTIQRLFIIDSMSIQTTIKTSALINPDAIEIMPGVMPKITKQLSQKLDVPVIVGGLISEEKDIVNAIENGALGVSTSSKELWGMKL